METWYLIHEIGVEKIEASDDLAALSMIITATEKLGIAPVDGKFTKYFEIKKDGKFSVEILQLMKETGILVPQD